MSVTENRPLVPYIHKKPDLKLLGTRLKCQLRMNSDDLRDDPRSLEQIDECLRISLAVVLNSAKMMDLDLPVCQIRFLPEGMGSTDFNKPPFSCLEP